jgi:hypothetical protein
MEISVFPYTPNFLDSEAQSLLGEQYGAADMLCRRDANTGAVYVDVTAFDSFIQETANGCLAQTWGALKPQLSANIVRTPNSSDDPHIGWGQALQSAGLQPNAAMENALRHILSTEEAWGVLSREDSRIAHLPPQTFAENFKAIHDRLIARLGLGEDDATAASGSVGGCFAQAGLVWVIIFFVVAVVIIVGLVVSGGTFAAVLAAVVGWVWATAGLWATIGALIDLVVCLCSVLNAGCSFGGGGGGGE